MSFECSLVSQFVSSGIIQSFLSLVCEKIISCSPDQDFGCFYPFDIILSPIPLPTHGKDRTEKEQSHA